MNILFLGNNTRHLADWLSGTGESVVYLEERITLDDVKAIGPDFIVSYNYRFIIKKDIIDRVTGNAVNLHISYLPYNRGSHPNVWSFLENTPKGVTIHYIDEGVDTGKIIAQKTVFFDEEKETLKSSYDILHSEIQSLFKEYWERIRKNEIVAKAQVGEGSIHFKKDIVKFERLLGEEGWDMPVSQIRKRYAEQFQDGSN